MILVHVQETEDGQIQVRLPDGSLRWTTVSEMKALAESDRPAQETEGEETKPKGRARK